MVTRLEELAERIRRVRQLVAEISHDLDVGDAEVRDAKDEATCRRFRSGIGRW